MQQEGVTPSPVTYVCSMKACGSMAIIGKGEELHAEVARRGLLKGDLVLGSTIVDRDCTTSGYAQQGFFADAQELSDNLPDRTVVSWNALIAGYAGYGLGEDALKCFDQMRLEGVDPIAGTFVSALKTCGSIKVIEKGWEFHTEVSQNGLLESDLSIGSTLVCMYVKCGNLAKARDVFEKLPVQDSFAWNALISGYTEQGLLANALELFGQLSF